MKNRVCVWGLPIAPMTRSQTVDKVFELIQAGQPSFFITANTHYAMLTHETHALRAINDQADFVVADGAPLVWASRYKGRSLPERVAGSDLILDLCARAAYGGQRIFLLGGAEGVADAAAESLFRRFPGIRIVGTECPQIRELSADAHATLVDRIRATRPDILFVAFGQPRGESWIAEHLKDLGNPVCVQVGASLDFVAGRIRRAPYRLQRLGLEWAYRLWLEPSRLGPRYARNAVFLLRMVARDMFQGIGEVFTGSRSSDLGLRRQPGRGY